MKWAVGFLVVSCLITAAGVALIVTRVNSGLVNSETGSLSTGAFTGENAATPTGDNLPINRSGAAATITAAVGQVTAAASTAVAVRTPLSGAPGAGSAVAVGQPVTVGDSRFTVHQVLDPEPPGLFKTTEGNRRVGIEITQEALTAQQQYHFAQFKIRDTSGTIYTWAIANGDPQFLVGTLAPGESRRGWLSFQVPNGAALDALIFQRLTETTGTAIVDLR
jgi:hypothetical protein